MTLKPYPKYKDTGIEWLGEIPEGWEIKRLKYVAYAEMGQSPDSDFYNKDGKGIPFLQGNADFKKVYPQPQVWTIRGNKYSHENDILISVRAPVGEVNISNDRYVIGRGLAALRFNKKLNFKYFYYIFLKSKIYFDSVSTGTTYSAISTNDIKNIIVAVPPLEHQNKIANYLDQKTSRIDELIKKNGKLIELLKEKRQAVISQAVTKGIPPCPPLEKGGWGDLKMKDSGIEWLGEIPEWWEIKRFKYCLTLIKEKSVKVDAIKVGLENIESWTGKYIETESEFEGSGITFQKEDILFGKLRPYLAKVLHPDFSGDAVGDFFVYHSNLDIYSRFGFYLLLSKHFISIVNSSTFGAKMPRVSANFIANLKVAYPQKSEQYRIANFLDQKTAKIDKLIKKIQSQNEKLKEYRQTLISNVVTGKVMVVETGFKCLYKTTTTTVTM